MSNEPRLRFGARLNLTRYTILSTAERVAQQVRANKVNFVSSSLVANPTAELGKKAFLVPRPRWLERGQVCWFTECAL